jgi:hypothetical protein
MCIFLIIIIYHIIMTAYEPYLFTLQNGKRLIDHIKQYSHHKLQHVKKIVNVFQPYYKNKKGCGLGDFIKGCYFLYQYCKIANKGCEINMRYHLISSMVDIEYPEIPLHQQHAIEMCDNKNFHPNVFDKQNIIHYISTIESIHSYLSRCTIEHQTMYVYLTCYPLFTIEDDARTFIKYSFEPSYLIDHMVSSMLESHQLETRTYHLIQIRCGDSCLIHHDTLHQSSISRLVSAIKRHMESQKTYILIADSDALKKTMVSYLPDLIIHDYAIAHTGEGVGQQSAGLVGTTIDYILLSGALSIYSISTYEHGSSFSKWCAETYRIPYTCSFLKMNS